MYLELSILNRFHKQEYFKVLSDSEVIHDSAIKNSLNYILKKIFFWRHKKYQIKSKVHYYDNKNIPLLERFDFVGYVLVEDT